MVDFGSAIIAFFWRTQTVNEGKREGKQALTLSAGLLLKAREGRSSQEREKEAKGLQTRAIKKDELLRSWERGKNEKRRANGEQERAVGAKREASAYESERRKEARGE